MANHEASEETDDSTDEDARSIDQARPQLGLHEKCDDPQRVCTCLGKVFHVNVKSLFQT